MRLHDFDFLFDICQTNQRKLDAHQKLFSALNKTCYSCQFILQCSEIYQSKLFWVHEIYFSLHTSYSLLTSFLLTFIVKSYTKLYKYNHGSMHLNFLRQRTWLYLRIVTFIRYLPIYNLMRISCALKWMFNKNKDRENRSIPYTLQPI